MRRLHPISYDQLKKWLKRNHYKMTVFTMGGTSYLIITYLQDEDSICITGSNETSILVNKAIWEIAMSYIKSIAKDEDTWKVKSYALPNIVVPG